MTRELKQLCQNRAKSYNEYDKNGRSDIDKEVFTNITTLRSDLITKAKEKYLISWRQIE